MWVEFAHSQKLQNAAFDLLQPVVVAVEDAAGAGDFEHIGGAFGPRQLAHPVQIGANDAVVRRGRVDFAEPIQFAQGLGLDGLGHLGGLELGVQFLDLFGAAVVLPQLGLNGLQLFLQKILTLAFVDRVAHLSLYLVAQFEHLADWPWRRRFFEPFVVGLLQQQLLFVDGDVQRRGQKIGSAEGS